MTKTWGPFTGRQLTAIIITLAAVVMVPGAAFAVDAFTNVAIEDPVSGAKAGVDATHHVLVGDSSGALSVDGSLFARPIAPILPWRFSLDTGPSAVALVGPSSRPINITNLTIAVSDNQPLAPIAGVVLYQYGATADGAGCDLTINGFQQVVYQVPNVHDTAPVVISFPTPLVLRPVAGQKICLVGRASGTVAVVNGSGFFV